MWWSLLLVIDTSVVGFGSFSETADALGHSQASVLKFVILSKKQFF